MQFNVMLRTGGFHKYGEIDGKRRYNGIILTFGRHLSFIISGSPLPFFTSE